MSGPSTDAIESAAKLLAAVEREIGPHAYDTLLASIARELQEKFDLGHKSAGGGLLEIALDQEEIDVIGNIVEMAEPSGERACAAVNRFIEKITLFRRRPR